MKFTDILKRVIVEQSKMDVLADKLTKPQGEKKPLLNPEELFALVAADPESKIQPDADIDSFKGDFSVVNKVGPYTQWLIKQYLSLVPMQGDGETPVPKENEKLYKSVLKQERNQFFEDLYKTTDDLRKFHRFKNRLPQDQRDINKMTIKSLFDAVKDFSLEKTKATKDEKKQASSTFEFPGSEVIYNGPNWAVTKVSDQGKLGKEAACFFGGYHDETRWCTSSPGLTWFENYIKDGPLYQVFNKNSAPTDKTGLPGERYQFHFGRNQFMDIHDSSIQLVDFLKNKAPEIKELFKSEFAKGLQKSSGNDKQLTIEYPRDSTSKYVALYGWDDLFNSLDTDLTTIDFTNSSNEELDLKFPKKLADMKNLQTFYVENAISKVPEELKGLTNLEFVSFPNNKNLKELPEWLADLPNLMAISAKGTPRNLVIPEKLQKRIDSGDLWFVHNEG
jgi:hypothetical protein